MYFTQPIGQLIKRHTKDNPVYHGVIYTFHPTNQKDNHIKESYTPKDQEILNIIDDYVDNPRIEQNNPCNQLGM